MNEQRRSDEGLLSALSEALKSECGRLATVLSLLAEVEERGLHLQLAYSSIFAFCREHLMRHRNLSGDLAIVVEHALDLLIAKIEKEKFAATSRPRPPKPSGAVAENRENHLAETRDRSRTTKHATPPATAGRQRVAAAAERGDAFVGLGVGVGLGVDAPVLSTAGVTAQKADSGTNVVETASSKPDASRRREALPAETRRAVAARDQGQCAYVSPAGKRCSSRDLIEFDHQHPHALGGANDVENLRLLCRAHNDYEAARIFGRKTIDRAIEHRKQHRRLPSTKPPR